MVLGLLIALMIVVVWGVAIRDWLKSCEDWNGGTCEENGEPWRVVDAPSGLYLFAGNVSRKVKGVLVCSGILKAADRR